MPAPGKNTSVSLKPQKTSTYTMPIKRAETDEEKKKKYQQAVEQHNKDYYNFVDLYTGKKSAVDAGYGPRSTSPLGQAITTQQAAADTRNKWKSTWGKYEATTGNLMPSNVHTAIGGDAYQDKLNEMLGKTGNQYKAGQASDWLLENTARTFRSNNTGKGTALTGREETQARLAGYNTNNDLARYEMGTKGKRPELGDSGNYKKDAVDVAAWDQEARSYGGAFDKDAALQAGRTNALTAQDYRDLAAGYRKQNEDSEIGQLYAKADAIKAKEDAENNGGEWYTGTDQADKDWNDLLDGVARSYFGLKNYDAAWNTGKGEAVSGIATQMMTGDRSELEKRTTNEDYANRGANGIYFANDWWATKADNMAASLDATEALDQELRTLGGYGSTDAGKYNPTESGTELIDLINSKDARDRATKEKAERTGEANWNLATDKELDILDSVEMMTPDEIDKANKWYNLAGSEGLQRYMDALQGQLWMRQTQAEEAQQQDEIRNGSLFENLGRFAVRAGVQAINSPQGWLNMAGALFGDEMANDPNSPAYRGQQFVANMDRGLAAKLDADFGGNGVGQFFYGVAASSVDSMLSSLIGSAAGPSLVENVSLAIMGSEAMSRSLYDGLKAGKSPNECVADALASGIIETLTEKIAWKDIFQGKGGLRAWAQSTMEEGLEEGVGNVAGKVYDDLKSVITGHETEIEEQVNEMLAKNPGMPINKVMNTILGQYASELGNDILAGAASGAGMSGVMQIINGINNTSTGSRVMANGLNLDAGKVTINESALSDPANAILPNVMAQAAGLEVADDIVTKPARAPQGTINEASVQDNSDIRENAAENPAITEENPANARELTPEEQARLEERSAGETAPAPAPEQKTPQATPPQRPKRPRSASIADNANVSRLLDLADGFGSDTEAGQTAAKIRDDIAKGKRVSKARVGQLFSEVAAALPEQGQSTVIDTMTEGVQDRLTELGEDRATAAQISEVIGKIAAGMDVARSDMAALAASKYGMDVLNEFMVDENASDTIRETKARAQEAAETNAQIQSEVSDMARKPDKKAKAKAPAAPRGAITETAKQDNSTGTKTTAAADQLTRKNTKAKPASKRVTFTQAEAGGATDGEITKITNVAKDGTVTVEVKDSEGKTRTIEADPSEIQMDGAGTAGIISEIQNSDRLFTAEEANGMLQTYDCGDVKAHVEAFDRAYRDGWNHPGETRNNKSSKTFEEIAYTLGQDDHKTVIGLRSRAATQAKNITNGKGSVTLETKGENAVKSFSNLRELVKKGSRNQSSAVQVIQQIADSLDMNIVLYEGSGENTETGYYDKDTRTVGIDINAGATGITNHALLSVAGHELTHHIQDNVGGEAWAGLVDMAKAELSRRGINWDSAIDRTITNWAGKTKLDMDGAEAELTANVMSDMLGSEDSLRSFLEDTARTRPTLYQRITDWLKGLADKLRNAFRNTNALSREAQAIRDTGGYSQDTVNMWYRLIRETRQQAEGFAQAQATAQAENTDTAAIEDTADDQTLDRIEEAPMEISEEIERETGDLQYAVANYDQMQTIRYMLDLAQRDPDGKTLGTKAERDALRSFRENFKTMQDAWNAEKNMRNIAEYIANNSDVVNDANNKAGYEETLAKAEEQHEIMEQAKDEIGKLTRQGALGDMIRQAERITDMLAGRNQNRTGAAAKGLARSARDVRKILQKTAADLQTEIDRLKGRLTGTDTSLSSTVSRWAERYDTQTTRKVVAEMRKAGFRYGGTNATEMANALAVLASMEEGEERTDLAEKLAERWIKSELGDQAALNRELLNQITGGSILLGTEDVKYLKATYGITVKEFEQMLPGVRVRVDKNSTTHADHIADDAGDWAYDLLFPENMSGSEATALDQLVSQFTVDPYYDTYSGMTYNELIEGYGQQLLEGANKMKLADEADAQRLRDTERAATEAKETVREAARYYERLFAQDKIQSLERLEAQLKSEALQDLAELKQKFTEQQNRARDLRNLHDEISRSKRHIQRVTARIDNLIRHETDYKNVPEDMKPLAEAAVGLISASDANGNRLVFDRARAQKLASVYGQLAGTDGSVTSQIYDPDTMDALDDLTNAIDERGQLRIKNGLTSMERAQAEADLVARIRDAMDTIYGSIRQSQQAFFDGRSMEISAAADPMIDELNQTKFYGERQGAAGRAIAMAERFIKTNNLTPVYFTRAVGNKGFTTLMDSIFHGESRFGIRLGQANDTIQDIQNKYNYKDWANVKDDQLTFTTEKGRSVTLTREQALSVYAAYQREHLNGMESHHLDQGGIVFGEERKGGFYSRESEAELDVRTKPAQISDEDMKQIRDWLTEEQIDYANAMVKYLSEDMSEIGNETSMALFGIKKYKERYYFPFKSYSGSLYVRSDAGSTSTTNDARLKHRSFTKALIRGAATPLVISDFTNTVANHVQEMLTYSSFAVPIESLNRVLNYKFDNGNQQAMSVRTLFERKYGKAMTGYLSDFLRDLNGGVQSDTRTTAMGRMISLFKKNAVVASLSVAAQQPLSIIRAYTVMDRAALVKARAKTANPVAAIRAYNEAKQYAGTAVIKDMGRFDTGVGYGAAEYLANNVNRGMDLVKERFDKATGLAPEFMDKWTWGSMWEGVKNEQAKLHPGMDVNSEAFLKICGRRFDQVMRLTQVYDSTLSRSSNMRAKDPMMQMVTAFMAEPTLTVNMLYDAFANRRKNNANKINPGAALSAFVISAALQSVIKGLFSAARRKDQDEDKSLVEKAAATIIENFKDEINPINSIPGARDIWAMLHGDSVERSDLTVISDVVKAAEKLAKTIDNGIGGSGAYQTEYIAVEEFGGTVAKLFGLPVKNIMRDIRGMWNFGEDVLDDKTVDLNNLRMTADDAVRGLSGSKAKAKHYENLYEALRKGDKDTAEREAAYLTDSLGAKDTAVTTAMKQLIRDGYLAGDLDDKEATKLLVDNSYAKSEKDAWTYLGKAADKAEHGEQYGTSGSVYGALLDAIDKGDTKAAEREYNLLVTHDIDEKSVKEKVRSHAKDQYFDGTISRDKADRLLREYGIDNDNERYWKLQEWDYQKVNGKDAKWNKYLSLDDALDSGDENAIYNAMQELSSHGVSETTLKSSLTKWKKMREDAGITINGAKLMAYNKARKSYFGRLYSKDKAGK